MLKLITFIILDTETKTTFSLGDTSGFSIHSPKTEDLSEALENFARFQATNKFKELVKSVERCNDVVDK